MQSFGSMRYQRSFLLLILALLPVIRSLRLSRFPQRIRHHILLQARRAGATFSESAIAVVPALDSESPFPKLTPKKASPASTTIKPTTIDKIKVSRPKAAAKKPKPATIKAKPKSSPRNIPLPVLNAPSEEQKAIIDAIGNQNCNVRCSAVAGSGKTTTLLQIASHHPNLSILALLYNARLKDETRLKRSAFNLTNLEAHSYNALALKYYRALDAITDQGILRIVEDDLPPKQPLNFDVFILDEVQDMTPLLYRFVCKVLRDQALQRNGQTDFSLLLLGDERQNIYQFKKADGRYLSLAEQVFRPMNDKPWMKLELRTTFRLTKNICSFLNDQMLQFPLFKTPKADGAKVLYYQGNVYQCVQDIGKRLVKLLQANKYSADDIFLLAPSVKMGSADNQTPLNEIANYLQSEGYLYYAPISDETALDEKVIEGKVCVTTFHQSKGLERKVAVVFSFSKSYFDFYAKNAIKTVCANTLYVAATRASELLIVIGEDSENGHLPFFPAAFDTNNKLYPYMEVKQMTSLRKNAIVACKDTKTVSVTRLTKYLPDTVVAEAMQFMELAIVSKPTHELKLKSVVKTTGSFVEEVSDLTGLAIPALYERFTTDATSTIQKYAKETFARASKTVKHEPSSFTAVRSKSSATASSSSSSSEVSDEAFLAECSKEYAITDIAGHLRLAALYSYATTGFANKPIQLTRYDWVPEEDVETCFDTLRLHLGEKAIDYEQEISLQFRNNGLLLTINGRIDAVTENEVWELKCTGQIEQEHILQLGLYAWMYQHPNTTVSSLLDAKAAYSRRKKKITASDTNTNTNLNNKLPSRKFRLLNMRTGEVQEITSSYQELNNMATALIQNHLKTEVMVTDEEFMKQVEGIRGRWFPVANSIQAASGADNDDDEVGDDVWSERKPFSAKTAPASKSSSSSVVTRKKKASNNAASSDSN